MKHPLRILVILLFTGLAASCSKDDDAASADRRQLLSEKLWITTALTIEPGVQVTQGGPIITDLFSFYQSEGGACINDDVKLFNLNGTYTFEEGATKCSPTNPQVYESGTWLLSSDESAIVTVVGGKSTNYDIITLNANSLIWKYVLQTQSGPLTFEQTHALVE